MRRRGHWDRQQNQALTLLGLYLFSALFTATITLWLGLTILLGISFLALQVAEYRHAYEEMGLTLTSGIYGNTFFLLTGFHGLHVTLGAIILLFVFFRVLKGHFTPEKHFAFQAAAWYWHFVDVVWLCLFIFVYVL